MQYYLSIGNTALTLKTYRFAVKVNAVGSTVNMSNFEQESWKSKVNRLKGDLEAAKFKDTLSVNDFDSFQGALQHLFTRYSRYPLAKFVNERLAPYFDHVKSFDKAITVSVQQNACASYVWSASLAIIEVCGSWMFFNIVTQRSDKV